MILDSGTMPDGQLYYAMEYIPGCNLEQVWRELSGSVQARDASTLSSSSWNQAIHSASRKNREQTSQRIGRLPGPMRPPPPVSQFQIPPLPDLKPAADDPGGYTRQVAALVRDAARALQAIHDQGVVHRDVKPANLMLTPDGSRVVLMDFGLAKGQSQGLTSSGAGGLLGTLRYAAPEQLAAARMKVGPAADVRGLGVVLWELLTRRRLFVECQDEVSLTERIFGEDVPRLRTIDRAFDRDLEAIVARATERRASDRIAAADRFAEYLQLYLDGQPLPIRPPSSTELLALDSDPQVDRSVDRHADPARLRREPCHRLELAAPPSRTSGSPPRVSTRHASTFMRPTLICRNANRSEEMRIAPKNS